MPVFKLCMKIYKKNIKIIAIYFVVFFFVSFMMMSNITTNQPTSFSQTKMPIAFFSAESGPIIDGLESILGDRAVIVDLEDNVDLLQDALYFSRIEYVLRVPKGFSDSLISGSNDIQLQVSSRPESTVKVYLEMAIDHYLNRVQTYYRVYGDTKTPKEIVDYAIEDLAFDLPVNTLEPTQTSSQQSGQNLIPYVFNYLSYTLMFVMILGVSTIMLVFNQEEIKRRNLCAPIPARKMHRELFLANGVFALITWTALVLFSLAFAHEEIFQVNTLYYIVNSFVFAISVSCISFLIGTLAKNREAINAIANVFTLGTCFLSGVFVPQVILGKSVLKFASFLPTYWYVLANNRIAQSTSLSAAQLQGIFQAMAVELAFALAFFALAIALRTGRAGGKANLPFNKKALQS